MNKLCCQESVKILSSLIMQFLSLNDIPPAPGETHSCTNRIWQLHHQQSLPRLQFSSEVNASCSGGIDRPFEKCEPSEVANLRQCACPDPPKDNLIPPVGVWRGEEGRFITFSFSDQNTFLFEALEFFSWHFLFLKNSLKLFFFFLVEVYVVYSCPEARPSWVPWTEDSSVTFSCYGI